MLYQHRGLFILKQSGSVNNTQSNGGIYTNTEMRVLMIIMSQPNLVNRRTLKRDAGCKVLESTATGVEPVLTTNY